MKLPSVPTSTSSVRSSWASFGSMYGRRVVAEYAEVAIDPQVDGRRLHAAVHQRFDDDAAFGERLVDRDVGEDHGPDTTRRRIGGADRPISQGAERIGLGLDDDLGPVAPVEESQHVGGVGAERPITVRFTASSRFTASVVPRNPPDANDTPVDECARPEHTVVRVTTVCARRRGHGTPSRAAADRTDRAAAAREAARAVGSARS